MEPLKHFVKRNASVFFVGLIITLVFLILILAQPKSEKGTPAGFKQVEEGIFESGEPREPEPTQTPPTDYASQIPSPDNKGKPYFFGEINPNLRDSEGYPTPPSAESVAVPDTPYPEQAAQIRGIARESYVKRVTPVQITYTDAGFEPKDTAGYTGQKIIWVNKSAKPITIKQTAPIHQALSNGLAIAPGASAIFRPLVTGLFSYLEENTGNYGTIYVNDVTAPLQ
jgi:hypothetical protein